MARVPGENWGRGIPPGGENIGAGCGGEGDMGVGPRKMDWGESCG